MTEEQSNQGWEPKIVASSATGAPMPGPTWPASAGSNIPEREDHPVPHGPDQSLLHPQGMQEGADGVLVSGCIRRVSLPHRNLAARRKFAALKSFLHTSPGRRQDPLHRVSAARGRPVCPGGAGCDRMPVRALDRRRSWSRGMNSRKGGARVRYKDDAIMHEESVAVERWRRRSG